jgi:hypothetical protein
MDDGIVMSLVERIEWLAKQVGKLSVAQPVPADLMQVAPPMDAPKPAVAAKVLQHLREVTEVYETTDANSSVVYARNPANSLTVGDLRAILAALQPAG